MEGLIAFRPAAGRILTLIQTAQSSCSRTFSNPFRLKNLLNSYSTLNISDVFQIHLDRKSKEYYCDILKFRWLAMKSYFNFDVDECQSFLKVLNCLQFLVYNSFQFMGTGNQTSSLRLNCSSRWVGFPTQAEGGFNYKCGQT